MKKVGYLLTVLQFGILGAIVSVYPHTPSTTLGKIVLVLSVLIGLWALFTFRNTRINIFPFVRKGSRIVKSGPYRIVRHPMYTAVLLFALSYLFHENSTVEAVLFVLLFFVILLKIKFEEKRLKEHFADYEIVFFGVYRIIPCVF